MAHGRHILPAWVVFQFESIALPVARAPMRRLPCPTTPAGPGQRQRTTRPARSENRASRVERLYDRVVAIPLAVRITPGERWQALNSVETQCPIPAIAMT